ncbi:hypothetical protein [Nostoc sp.]|uniref:hypothetical protein n=1 Tax=Nostoc sp. TaxID=1180 RepID=UPI002FF916BF
MEFIPRRVGLELVKFEVSDVYDELRLPISHHFISKARHQRVFADIWALIPPYVMHHPKRPSWWENKNEK